MSAREPRRLAIALLFLPLVLAGCTARDPFPVLYPLTGTVTRDGKPVAGGGLLFVPEPGAAAGLIVNASVGPDGTFAIQTEHTGSTGVAMRPGAPTGRYKVIYHPPGDGSKTGLEVTLEQSATVDAKANEAVLVLPPKSRPDPDLTK